MGTPEFAVPSLNILLDHGRDVVAVVTAPDKERGRGRALSPTPVKEAALSRNIPVLTPVSLKDPAFAESIRSLYPDLLVVVAFRILPRAVFALPRLGSFNLHSSLLPAYRGAAPIHWAVINGETETGVTTFFLDDTVDTGKIILQRKIPIGPDDDTGIVHDRLMLLGAGAVLETVDRIAEGSVQCVNQDNSKASGAPKIFKEDCRIDWRGGAEAVRNRIRGLSPHPAAFTTHNGKMIKIYRTHGVSAGPVGVPGSLRIDNGVLSVAVAGGTLAVDELQLEGKKRMGGAEFLRGYEIRTGELFQ